MVNFDLEDAKQGDMIIEKHNGNSGRVIYHKIISIEKDVLFLETILCRHDPSLVGNQFNVKFQYLKDIKINMCLVKLGRKEEISVIEETQYRLKKVMAD